VLLRETTWNRIFGIESIHAIPRFERWVANIGSQDKYWPNEDAAIRAVATELGEVVAEVERERAERRTKEADYRIRVAETLSDDDDITPYERRSLEEERSRLGLSETTAGAIEAGELQRHQAGLQTIRAYEADIEFAIRDVGLPFDDKTEQELKKRKAKLGLKDDDVVGLIEKVAARIEAGETTQKSNTGAEPVQQAPRVSDSENLEEDQAPIDAPEGPTPSSTGVAGQRVFARWEGDSFFYPGTIVEEVDGDHLVAFDDGERARLRTDEIALLNLEVGTRVSARYDGGAEYYPGRVRHRDGESVHIDFDDGADEATTISMIRVELP
jgi:hypothetical protein